MADKQLAKQINALREADLSGNGKISPAKPRDAIPARIGRSLESETSSPSGGGINSPLTEISRTIETVTLTDTTGLIQFDLDRVTKLTMEDSSRTEVIFNYESPT